MNYLKIKTRILPYFKSSEHTQGFTLVELLIAMAVGMVVLASVFGVFTLQNRQLNNQDQIAEMQQNARMALDMMSREIMMAGYGASSLTKCTGTTTATSTPCAGISAANANSISFSADLDGDGDLTPDSTNPNENITYDLYASSGIQALGRTSNGGSRSPVVEYVESLTFTYLDETGASTTNLKSSEPRGNSSCTGSGAPYACCTGSGTGTCNGIRTIQITITTKTAKIDPNTGAYKYFTLTTNVTPRNLGAPGY